ncbi:MAG: nucleotide exchange factor GrpE [Nitrospinales bacterium]
MDKDKEKEQEEKPKLMVTDRRHWVSETDEGNGGEEPQVDERLPTYVEKLKNEAEEKDKRLREYIAAFKAKSAENDEFRVRLQRENDSRLDLFKSKLFAKLVPILDNLKRSVQTAGNDRDFDSFKKGIEMIISQFTRDLQEQGVEEIKAQGRPFNPKTDEALLTVETTDPSQDNMVLEELEPGYMFKEKLVKPARVKVAKLT